MPPRGRAKRSIKKSPAIGVPFQNAHDFIIANPLFLNSTLNNDDFMKQFSEHTIQGAELDSSARDPPPRCHPGTRKEIVDRMQLWFRNPHRKMRWLWLVGQAGVGKSAIMQSVAELELISDESAILASLFFSGPNGRNDPSKVVITLAYQLAVRLPPYRDHMRNRITADPKLFKKAIDKQFADFIVEPFAKRRLHEGPGPILIFIDGLDECKERRSQLHFLDLISNFTTAYPDVPLLWVIASRPEPHITNHLSLAGIASTYDKEEVWVDSTESCKDVERFLRARLEEIRNSDQATRLLRQQWPFEHQILKLLAAALGLFAYADTAIRFISEGNHITRFQLVLDLIDKPSVHNSSTENLQPMTRLHVLYRHILFQVPDEDLPHATKILTFYLSSSWTSSVYLMCNLLQMTPDIMYNALRQLHSVLDVPSPDKYDKEIKIYHKSFSDFLRAQLPGLPIGKNDEQQWHLSQAIPFLNKIPLSILPQTPKIPHDVLSWPYQDTAQVKHAEDSFSIYLEALFATLCRPSSSIGSDITHALKVATDIVERVPWEICVCVFTCVSSWWRSITPQDDSSELVQRLREDGSLRDIPIRLLNPANIQADARLSVYDDDQNHISGRLGEEEHALVLSAQTRSPDMKIKIFIANRLRGWVDFCTIVDLHETGWPIYWRNEVIGAFLEYDFSAIYPTLEEQFDAESNYRDTASNAEDESSPSKPNITVSGLVPQAGSSLNPLAAPFVPRQYVQSVLRPDTAGVVSHPERQGKPKRSVGEWKYKAPRR